MAISVFDIYKVGVGPSSSHTFGPMVAAERFLKELEAENLFDRTAKAQVELYSSMSLTGKGHFTDLASMLGLEGNAPATLDSATIPAKQKRIETEKTLNLGGKKMTPFDPEQDIKWYSDKSFATHPNGIAFVALDKDGKEIKRGLYFSIGGGFVICEHESTHPKQAVGDKKKPFPYTTAAELAALCKKEGKSIAQIVFQNELTWREAPEIKKQLLEIAAVMEKSIEIGLETEGEIPGLGLKRHAKEIWDKVKAVPWGAQLFELQDHVNAYALAVMEVNATLGQVVTAPTMGASGIVPAVLQAYKKFGKDVTDDSICDFLLASGGCAIPVKINASFSGAEVGCQGEVGSASLMAATGLCEVLGADRSASAERRRDGARTQPRTHVRPGCRTGAGALHQAQCARCEQGRQRSAPDHVERRGTSATDIRSGRRSPVPHGQGHVGQVQGDVAGWSRRRLGRLLKTNGATT